MANAQSTAAQGLADGVEYSTIAGAGALLFFHCDRLRCRLSTKGCADRWRKAEGGEPVEPWRAANQSGRRRGPGQRMAAANEASDRMMVCRGCPIGAAHAGSKHVAYSQYFGAAICPRCRRGTTRMIQGRVCVSCRNREYELERGANARGNVPTELLASAPHVVELRVIEGGHARVVRHERAVDLLEPVFQTLRTTKGAVAFGFQGATGLLRQGRLF